MAPITREAEAGCTRLRLSNGTANVLTIDVVAALSEALRDAGRDGSAVMLCGGERFFCNGLDLAWALTRTSAQMRAMFLALGDLVLQMLTLPVPIVGVARGHAVGAGKTLLTACDLRFGATGRVLLGVPEILLGVPNPWFADRLLHAIAGDAAASDLIYSGRLITAEQALPLGIVQHVAEKAEVEAAAWARTAAMAVLPRAAFAECKAMRTERLCAEIRAGLGARTDRLIAIWSLPETQARLQAAAAKLAT